MRIGVNITLTTTPERVADDVASAADAGFDTVWTNQHPGRWDPLALLGAAGRAAAGTGLELGTAIVQTYPRHPVVVATEALTVQAATGAPLALGFGPSHRQVIVDQFGLAYDSPAAHSREYLTVVRGLLRGEHVRHEGRFYAVDTRLDVADGVRPPSLLLSALAPRMLAVAADLAEGAVAVWVGPGFVADTLVPALPDGGRAVVQVLAAVTVDPDAVRAQVARDFAVTRDFASYRNHFERTGASGPADSAVIGTEEEVARALGAFADAGTTDLMVSPLGPEPSRVLTVARELGAATTVSVRGGSDPAQASEGSPHAGRVGAGAGRGGRCGTMRQ